jgi:NAD-dependent dihydropyrimidine dehydrogenase PreA subunit
MYPVIDYHNCSEAPACHEVCPAEVPEEELMTEIQVPI